MEFSLYGTISEDEHNNTYVFGSHQYALYYWARAIFQNQLSPNAQLIHIDFHSDFLSAGTNLKTLLSIDEIKSLIENKKIQNDTFIKPAISMGIVYEIAFCCFPHRRQPYGDFVNYSSPVEILNMLYSNEQANNIILNIDLDYFFTANKKRVMVPKERYEIINEIETINKIFEFASITTIATSPEIGKDKQQKFIREIFAEHFVVKINFDNPMKVIDFYGRN